MPSDDVKLSSSLNLSVVVPILTAIIAGLIALLSNIYSTYLSSNNQLELEKQRLKANLILESVKTGDKDKAVDNLRFFIEAGFIEDPDGKIASLVAERTLPVLPAAFADLHKQFEESHQNFIEADKKAQEVIHHLESLSRETPNRDGRHR
jgi:hypothetical protein